MKKNIFSLVILALLLSACSSYPYTTPKIDRHPPATSFGGAQVNSLPTYDPESTKMWQVDLRSVDLSNLNLSDSLKDLLFASFDDRTIWPPADKMPEDYDWKRIMELGKNPGLNIHSLHQ